MYKTKYLKYKQKYLQLKNQSGGIVNEIPREQLTEKISNYDVPEAMQDYIDLITVPGTGIIPVGSSRLRIQKFFSDIDIMNIVQKPYDVDGVVNFFIKEIKIMVNKILNKKGVFFSDFKAGGLHWKVDEILNEKKDNISLIDACKTQGVVKIDIIGPYDGRYLEMSTFFVLKTKTKDINSNLDNFEQSLLKDIEHYKNEKTFKAIKRVWSLATLKKDYTTLEKLQKLIGSNLSLLSQINADIETIVLLIEHKNNYDIALIIDELNKFKEHLSHIVDIVFKRDLIVSLIDKLILLFKINKEYNVNKNIKEISDTIKRIHDMLLETINKETLEYMKSVNYEFPNHSNNNNNDTKDIQSVTDNSDDMQSVSDNGVISNLLK